MLLVVRRVPWALTRLSRQVFLLPTLLLLTPLTTSYLSSSARSSPLPKTFSITCLATSFLVALALFGVPARHSGLAVAALRLPAVAIKMLLLKEGLGEGQLGEYLTTCATVSLHDRQQRADS